MIRMSPFLAGEQMLEGPPVAGVVNILFSFKAKAKLNYIQFNWDTLQIE